MLMVPLFRTSLDHMQHISDLLWIVQSSNKRRQNYHFLSKGVKWNLNKWNEQMNIVEVKEPIDNHEEEQRCLHKEEEDLDYKHPHQEVKDTASICRITQIVYPIWL